MDASTPSGDATSSSEAESPKEARPSGEPPELVALDPEAELWERILLPAPLVVVGTREEDGSLDLAPKHMAGPMGWDAFFGFVCTPRHASYHNARRTGVFTVSYPRASQVVGASLTASPRSEEGTKPELRALPTLPAAEVDGEYLAGCRLMLGCEVERVVDELGSNSLVIGRVVEARVDPRALRGADRDDAELLRRSPVLVYLHPGRFARVAASYSFPFPKGFRR